MEEGSFRENSLCALKKIKISLEGDLDEEYDG
jgi:hypothetical protein